MRIKLIGTLLLVGTLAGCATAPGMEHGGMNHEEMMLHCQMMEQHEGQAGQDATHHDPAEHGGMSHEEMRRHCASMRDGAGAPAPQH